MCAYQLFEQQAEKTPDALAVIIPAKDDRPRQQITYQDLNTRSNLLANALRSRGVAPGQVVGICIERSLEMITGILGIMKSGAAYLPLDPLQPKDRLDDMIENASPVCILTQRSLTDNLPNREISLIFLDADWEPIGAAENETRNPVPLSGPDDPAYLIYTSGSTGRSKGVVVHHRNLTNAFFAWQDAYELDTVKAHLQMANFAFDVFSGDFVRALCSGGHLVICPRDWLLAPKQLYELIENENVEIAEFVPAVYRFLIQYLEDENLRLDSMRLLICGSDVWYMEEYKKFSRFCGPRTRLINSFGLTEATIDSSFYEAADFKHALRSDTAHRAAVRQPAPLYSGRAPAAGAHRRTRRIIYWRSGRRPGILPQPGFERRALFARSLPARIRRDDLQNRRSGAHPPRRPCRFPGAS